MPIISVKGSIFEAPDDFFLTDPVNCEGVSGKGLAAEFDKKFPEEVQAYRRIALNGELRPGGVYLHGRVVFFATKDKWKNPSRLKWIEEGLMHLSKRLASRCKKAGMKGIALPLLGCGLGGLREEQVRSMMHFIMNGSDTEIRVYEPHA